MNREVKTSSRVVLAIAGFDPSGGAGIIADIGTIHSFGGVPVGAITSVTFQNATTFLGSVHQSVESLRSQVLAAIEGREIGAVKIGMLPTADIAREVARLLRELNLPAPVVDPVLRSTSGHALMEDAAVEVLLTELLPLARVITPNIPEAETLTGLKIQNEGEMLGAARRLRKMGARAVLIKGGHLSRGSGVRGQGSGSDQAVDVLDCDDRVTVFRGEWIAVSPVRGTGCMLSSAIAACLAQGVELEKSVQLAKEFVANAISNAPRLRVDPVTLELTEPTNS